MEDATKLELTTDARLKMYTFQLRFSTVKLSNPFSLPQHSTFHIYERLDTPRSFPSSTLHVDHQQSICSVGEVLLQEMSSSKAPEGHFTILYFASASSYTKKDSENFKAPLAAGSLFTLLEKDYPGIKSKVLVSCAVTVNLEYIDMDGGAVTIKEGDEVAIIPPVSSG